LIVFHRSFASDQPSCHEKLRLDRDSEIGDQGVACLACAPCDCNLLSPLLEELRRLARVGQRPCLACLSPNLSCPSLFEASPSKN
jgi:hypothetical protein